MTVSFPLRCAFALFLLAAPAGAQTSSEVYGAACTEEIGAIPVFDCAAGVAVPVTVDGIVVTDHAPERCDHPALLSNGAQSDGQCVPHSRILNLSTQTAQVSVMCRQKVYRDASSTAYDEIDVIAHNPATGATCWFQAKADAGAAISGVHVPSPTAATDDQFWETPERVASDGCGTCHDNDPFMYSPFVGQVWSNVPVNPFGPYAHVEPGMGFAAWPTTVMDMRDNTCTGCHRIGSGQVGGLDGPWGGEKPGSCGQLADFMTGRQIPEGADSRAATYPGSHAMPPAFGGSEAAWNVIYAQSMSQVQSCCSDPEQAICGLTPIRSYLDALEVK
ncbi:hypothetical protein P775_09085 [Puniceibacterium antarcticum]|uniref:Cytochrome c-552/4 domain-containing protein n=1 Tax=Puniceibacterium antarcticum TaxID=1206336 RepID=A0A2G8RGY6_9RHOB|nr:hypothetical protein [Puniceibacterium antarcticum]PIL20671.1 hypothetical protein P775_09085 [Puniceibacterium antarcticum]